MSVKYLIDDIAEKAKGFSRARILRLLDDGQRYLFSKPCRQTTYVVPTTGLLPTIDTVTGTFKYDAPDCLKTIGGVSRTLRMMKVSKVLKKYTDGYIKDYGYPIGYNGYTFNQTVYEELNVDSYDALESDRAYVIFREDPGTTTGTIYIEGTITPFQLTAETIPLSIPKIWEEALFDYVVGKIEDQNYGNDNRQLKWHEFWAPKIWSAQNDGSPRIPHASSFL